jgi:hypothetical protein
MSCKVIRDKDNNIVKVLTESGKRSKLFEAVASHPLVNTAEEALGMYKNIYAKKVEDKKPPKGNRIFNNPLKEVSEIADVYFEKAGIEKDKFEGVTKVDTGRGKLIAKLFDQMQETPNNKETAEAYNKMVEETIEQYKVITSFGYQVEVNNSEPYNNSSDMIEDLRQNKNMKIFSTESGFGDTAITEEQRKNNPLLQRTEFTDKNGVPLLANDLFRFVHDFFGHAELGNGFGVIGEENAWNVHARMYSPLARRAMTTETRGQNSFVNFSGINDKVFEKRDKARRLRREGKLKEAKKLTEEVYEEMKFADQKVGLLPEWVSDPYADMSFLSTEFNKLTPIDQALLLGYEQNKKGSKVVNSEGEFRFLKGVQVPIEDVVDESIMTPQEKTILKQFKGKKINMYGGRGASQGIAFYNSSDNSISVNVNNQIGAVVLSNQIEVNRAVLHEIIHSIINNQVTNKEAFNKELTEILGELVKNKSKASPYVQRLIEHMENGSPEEVITYTFTHREVAEFLHSLSSVNKEGTKEQTIWSRLVNFIKNILKTNTLLSDTLSVINKYTETFWKNENNQIFSDELNNIKILDNKEEGGVTFDINRSFKPTSGVVLPLVSKNITKEELSPEAIDQFLEENKDLAINGELYLGIYKFPNSNLVSLDLSLITPKNNQAKALEIAKNIGQESIFNLDSDTNIKTGESGLNTKKLSQKEFQDIISELSVEEGSIEDSVTLSHRVGDQTFSTYKQALKNSQENAVIEVGFQIEGEFLTIASVNKNTNKDTRLGYINNSIESGTLSDTKKRVSNGEYRYQAAGETEAFQIINSEILNEDAKAYLGVDGVGKDGYTFRLDKTKNKVELTDKDGNKVQEDSTYLNIATFEEIKAKYGQQVALESVTGREWVRALNGKRMEADGRPKPRSERDLQLLLLNLLNKLGVTTTSISEYVKKYNSKHGVDPSAKALADIANQVIAFQEGEITVEQLTEETVHFIIEALPQEKIENILRNIHRTDEWAQFASVYRDIYSKEYETEAQIEEAVRREVLGKVLANALIGKFQPQTETQRNMLEKIVDAFIDFFSGVRNFFKSQYRQEIDNLAQEIEDLLYLEDLSSELNTENFKDNRFRLYSIDPNSGDAVTDKIRRASLAAIKTIQNQIHYAQKAVGKSTSKESAKLKSLEEQLNGEITVESISGVIQIANNYVRRLEAAVKDVEKNPLTSEQQTVFHSLKSSIIPALSDIQSVIDKIGLDKSTQTSLNDSINSVSNKMRILDSNVGTFTDAAVRNLAKKVQERHNLPDEYLEEIEKWIQTAEHDSTFFHQNFGQITHSRDPLLGLEGVTIKDMATERNNNALETQAWVLSELRKLGVSPQEFRKFIDGTSGMILSEWDWTAYHTDLDNIFINRIREVNPDLKDTPDAEILKRRSELTRALTNEQNIELNQRMRQDKQPLLEKMMTDEYYDKFSKRFENRGISNIGRQALLSYYASISDLHRKATVNGVRDLRNLSQYDLIEYGDLTQGQKAEKSFYSDTGTLKKGLELEVKSQEEIASAEAALQEVSAQVEATQNPSQALLQDYQTKLEDYVLAKNGLKKVGTLSNEAQVALDITKFNEGFEGKENSQAKQEFYEMLEDAFNESPEAGLEFLRLNSYVGFSENFWDSMTFSEDLKQKLRDKVDGDNMAQVDSIIETLEKDGRALKEILKQFKSKNNPAEIEVERMEGYVKDRVKQLQENLSQAYRESRSILGEQEVIEESEILTESTTNEAFRKVIRDLGYEVDLDGTMEDALNSLTEQVEFARDHMTSQNAKTTTDALYFIKKYFKGETNNLENRAVNDALLGESMESLNDVETLNKVVTRIISKRVLPYYKRFSPASYTDFMSKMADELITPKEKIDAIRNKRYEFIEVNPNPTFTEAQSSQDMNPNFISNFYGGVEQPKLSRYKNPRFEETFGQIQGKDHNDIMSGTSTKNAKLYEAYKLMLVWNKLGLDAADVSSSYNHYTAPQIRKGFIQRAKDLTANLSTRSIKEAIEEAIRFTPDEMITGETDYGSIKVIPTMFTKTMQNSEDVSTDLFWSIAMRNYEGFNKQSRMKHYGNMMALTDAIAKRATGNGKDVKATNTYKMMENFKNYALFGVKESWTYEVNTPFGKLDIARIVRKLINYIKWRNLGLNFVIPLTSAITGKTQLILESIVQEHIDRNSLKLGRKEFFKLLPEMSKDFNQIGKKSKGVVLMQYFRANDLMGSFENSNYSGTARFLPKTSMGLHAFSNVPMYAETTFGMLHYYRIVDGSIINKRDFERIHKDKSKAEINRMWSTHEKNAFYNFIDVVDGQVVFKNDELKALLTDENGNALSETAFQDYMDNKVKGLGDRMREVILNIDTMIPDETRLAVQRNALFSIFLTHKQFLPIAISRRTRSAFWNMQTGEYEQGTYRSNLNFIAEAIKEMQKVGSFNMIKHFHKAWKDAGATKEGQLQRLNLKRTAVDLGVITFLGIIGYLLFQAADDDEQESNYLLQTTAYFWQRLLNEASSVQKGGMGTTILDTMESPIVGLNLLTNLADAPDLFSSQEVSQGFYRGKTERYRFLSKSLPGISQYEYFRSAENVKAYRNMYKIFRSRGVNSSPFMQIATSLEGDD